MISFDLETGHNDPNGYWKRKMYRMYETNLSKTLASHKYSPHTLGSDILYY